MKCPVRVEVEEVQVVNGKVPEMRRSRKHHVDEDSVAGTPAQSFLLLERCLWSGVEWSGVELVNCIFLRRGSLRSLLLLTNVETAEITPQSVISNPIVSTTSENEKEKSSLWSSHLTREEFELPNVLPSLSSDKL